MDKQRSGLSCGATGMRLSSALSSCHVRLLDNNKLATCIVFGNTLITTHGERVEEKQTRLDDCNL